ncbi:hypothetical protein [Dongia sp. agr-C8]
MALAALVLILGFAYAIYYPSCCAKPEEAEAMQAFRTTCMQSARRANGGNGDLVMDDATEAKIGAYCHCMAEAVRRNLSEAEVARIAKGQTSDTTLALLGRIVDGCRAQME